MRGPHKTSGASDNENNFENHKNESQDFGNEPLKAAPFSIMEKFFKAILDV